MIDAASAQSPPPCANNARFSFAGNVISNFLELGNGLKSCESGVRLPLCGRSELDLPEAQVPQQKQDRQDSKDRSV
jgi:hypothetical protein